MFHGVEEADGPLAAAMLSRAEPARLAEVSSFVTEPVAQAG